MATRKQTAVSTWGDVECPTSRLPWSDELSIFELATLGDVLIVNCHSSIVFCDASEPRDLKVLARFKTHFGAGEVRVVPERHALIVITDSGIEVVDVTDPSRPRSQVRCAFEVGDALSRGAAFVEDELFITWHRGVARVDLKTGKPEQLFEVPGDDDFGSSPSAVVAHGRHLFVSGSYAGLHVLERTEHELTLLRSIRRESTPTTLTWWEPGRTLLMIGDDAIIPVDTSTVATTKLMKSLKVKGQLAPNLARDGNQALVMGATGKQIVFTTLDLSTPLAPVVIEQAKVPCDVDFDDAGGFARFGRHVLVASCQLDHIKVFERR